jgi:hypothetical protein
VAAVAPVAPAAVEPAPAAVEPVAPAAAAVEPAVPAAAAVELRIGDDAAPLKLTLRLDIDLAAGAIAIRFDDESDPITVVHSNGRWRATPTD